MTRLDPLQGVFLVTYGMNVPVKKVESLVRWQKPRDAAVINFDSTPACDIQTDRRTDVPPMSTSRYSIAERDKKTQTDRNTTALLHLPVYSTLLQLYEVEQFCQRPD